MTIYISDSDFTQIMHNALPGYAHPHIWRAKCRDVDRFASAAVWGLTQGWTRASRVNWYRVPLGVNAVLVSLVFRDLLGT